MTLRAAATLLAVLVVTGNGIRGGPLVGSTAVSTEA